MTLLDAAKRYTARGWRVVPVPYREKGPTLLDWQALRLTEARLPEVFSNAPGNIGLILGTPSGDLTDVDLDCGEARAAADRFLPATGMLSGRASSPRSHRWYLSAGATTAQFRDPVSGQMLVEVRATGGQTLVPPSTHPGGEVYRWEAHDPPAGVDADTLYRAAAHLAACCLIGRYWPSLGGRHHFALALGGWLVRGGLAEAVAVELVRQAATLAGADVAKRVQDVRDTYRRHGEGGDTTGGTTLVRDWPYTERLMPRLAEWLGLQPERVAPVATPSRPRLVRLADVAAEPVTWLWPGRLARGKLTLISGDPGLGKSLLLADLAARISAAREWPDRGTAPPGTVIMLSAEDGLSDTIRPRVEAAGGDLARVVVLEAVRTGDGERMFTLEADLPVLEDSIRKLGDVRLVTLDPVTAYLGTVDSHRDAPLRRILGPLAHLAERHGVAVVATAHLNKTTSGGREAVKALYRTGGSIALPAAARMAFLVAEAREDPSLRLLLHQKNNLAPVPPTLGFRVEETTIPNPQGEPVAYTGEAEHSDRPIVNAPIGDRDRSGATLAGRSAVELALLSP